MKNTLVSSGQQMKNIISNKRILLQSLLAIFIAYSSGFALATEVVPSINDEPDLFSKEDDIRQIYDFQVLESPLFQHPELKEYRVWFAEDQASIRKPFERVFKSCNTDTDEDWKLKTFVHEDEAIEYAKENKDALPDCVITDINMNHGKGGVHFAKFLREECGYQGHIVAATSAPEALTQDEKSYFNHVGDKVQRQHLTSIKSHIRNSLDLSTPKPIVPRLEFHADSKQISNSPDLTDRTRQLSIDSADRRSPEKLFFIRSLHNALTLKKIVNIDKKGEPFHNALEEKPGQELQCSTTPSSINETDKNDKDVHFSCCWPWQSIPSRNKVNPQRNVSSS